MNNSVMKCCICNNKKIGEFITINDKKYHLCCIEQLQNDWNELKKGLQSLFEFDEGVVSKDYLECVEDTLDKMQDLEGNNEN